MTIQQSCLRNGFVVTTLEKIWFQLFSCKSRMCKISPIILITNNKKIVFKFLIVDFCRFFSSEQHKTGKPIPGIKILFAVMQ